MKKVVIKSLTLKEQVNIFGGGWFYAKIKGYFKWILR
jgi:hypothetical protein